MTEEAHDDPHADALATAAQTVTAAVSVTAAVARLHQERTGQTDARSSVTTDVETANVVHRVALRRHRVDAADRPSGRADPWPTPTAPHHLRTRYRPTYAPSCSPSTRTPPTSSPSSSRPAGCRSTSTAGGSAQPPNRRLPGTWGYARPSWTSLTDELRTLGYSDETIEASGLALHARTGRLIDRFRDRLMLGIRDGRGDVVAFVGRAHPGADVRTPKYLNSPSTAVYRKGDHLFGLTETRSAIRAGGTPVLVEGPLDAIAVHIATTDGTRASRCAGRRSQPNKRPRWLRSAPVRRPR